MLIDAKQCGLLAAIGPLLDDLREKANFFLIGAVAALIAGALLLMVRKNLAEVVEEATASKD